ncbi:MAG: zinc ribbon domain-containing protein [Ilumatobacteraceae bacterium]
MQLRERPATYGRRRRRRDAVLRAGPVVAAVSCRARSWRTEPTSTRISGLLPAGIAQIGPNAWTKPFWDAAKEHRLVIPQDAEDGRFFFPPAPFTGRPSQNIRLVESSREGSPELSVRSGATSGPGTASETVGSGLRGHGSGVGRSLRLAHEIVRTSPVTSMIASPAE